MEMTQTLTTDKQTNCDFLLRSPGCPLTQRNLPSFALRMLELKICTTMPNKILFIEIVK